MTHLIRITRIFRFEMAHALPGHNGLCKHIHGHSYQLEVTVRGSVNNQPEHTDQGMVMDFACLKSIVEEEIIKRLDHALMLPEGILDPLSLQEYEIPLFGRIVLVPYRPTSENMVIDFAGRISRRLPAGVQLLTLRLYETSTAFASWHACDNREEAGGLQVITGT